MAPSKPRTHKSAAKRFKVTASGKVVHRAKGYRHLRSNKQKKNVRAFKHTKELTGAFSKKIKKLLGKA